MVESLLPKEFSTKGFLRPLLPAVFGLLADLEAPLFLILKLLEEVLAKSSEKRPN